MTQIQERLFALADETYAAFQAKLTPTINPASFIGVRLPALRKLAVEFEKTEECGGFLKSLPHTYYDENILHSILISRTKPVETCMKEIEVFLPYVDNWAVCDTLRPKVFEKHKTEVLPKIKEWAAAEETYTCRFGLDMLMTFFLDEEFQPGLLEIPASINSNEYYVNMMVAWYFATALAKQWKAAIPYIEERRLPEWTHRKTIQKACESYRITDEQKVYLKGLR